MTDLVLIALIAGVPGSLTALGLLAVNVRTAMDTKVILGHVNSEKTAAEGRELALKAENKLLRETLVDLRATAALLAQASAMRTRDIAGAIAALPIPAVAPDAVVESLHKIDSNTAVIAENTSKT